MSTKNVQNELQTLHAKRMDMPVATGFNLDSYAANAESTEREYKSFSERMQTAIANCKQTIADLKEKLGIKQQELEIATTDENGNTLQEVLSPIRKKYEPTIARLQKTVNDTQEKLQQEKTSEAKKSVKIFGEDNVIIKKRGNSKSENKKQMKFIAIELILLILILLCEVSLNKIVFYNLGYNENTSVFYAVVMSIIQSVWMFVAGYIIKIGTSHPTGKKKGYVVFGILMIIAMIATVYKLVELRNATMIAMDANYNANSNSGFFMLFSSILYLAGAVISWLFASGIPFWEENEVKKHQSNVLHYEEVLDDAETKLRETQHDYTDEMEDAKKSFTLDKDGKMLAKSTDALRKEVEVTIPEAISAAEKELTETEDEAKKVDGLIKTLLSEYAKELTKRYEEKHSDDDQFKSIRESLSKYLSILVVMVWVGLISSCSSPAPTTYSIRTVFDKTEKGIGYVNEVSPSTYTTLMHLSEKGTDKSYSTGTVTFTTLNAVEVNPTVELSLSYDINNTNDLNIIQWTRKFTQQLTDTIPALVKPSTTGEESSKLYGPIVDNLQALDKNANKKVLIICSDLIENGNGVSFYDEQLSPKTDSVIRSRLVAAYSKEMPSLSGVDIYIVYDQNKAKSLSTKTNLSSEFFKRWFESKGAKVSIKANL